MPTVHPGVSGANVVGTSAHPTGYGAPDLDTARPVAAEEIGFMREMCEDHDPNTLLVVTREIVDAGINESFRAIKPQDATIDMVAIHGELDEL